jgi:hypothetical protein
MTLQRTVCPPMVRLGGAPACLDCGLPQRWSPSACDLTTSGSRGLALAAYQIVMLRGLAQHRLHVFGQ